MPLKHAKQISEITYFQKVHFVTKMNTKTK